MASEVGTKAWIIWFLQGRIPSSLTTWAMVHADRSLVAPSYTPHLLPLEGVLAMLA